MDSCIEHRCPSRASTEGGERKFFSFLIDISNFAKYVVRGQKAGEWLDSIFANKVPSKVGRSCLSPLISSRGGLAGDFTINLVAKNEYWIFSSGIAEDYHKRFFLSVPLLNGVHFESKTEAFCGFNVAGPKSRQILQRLTNSSLNTKDFPHQTTQTAPSNLVHFDRFSTLCKPVPTRLRCASAKFPGHLGISGHWTLSI